MSLDFAPGATLSATIPAFSASLQRRRRGVPVRTSTRRKLCPSIGKLLGTRSPCSIKTTAAGSHHCRRPPQGGDQAPLTPDRLDQSLNRSVVDQDVDLSKLIGGLATVAAHPNRRGHSPGRLLHGRGYFTFISTATFARAVRSRATSSKSVRMRSTRGRITFLG